MFNCPKGVLMKITRDRACTMPCQGNDRVQCNEEHVINMITETCFVYLASISTILQMQQEQDKLGFFLYDQTKVWYQFAPSLVTDGCVIASHYLPLNILILMAFPSTASSLPSRASRPSVCCGGDTFSMFS